MDKVGKRLLESDLVLQKEVLAAFGDKAVTHGHLDRQKLRNLIFSNPENRQTLEKLVHPRVRKEFERLANEEEAKATKLIVCEAALLIESGYRNSLDKLTVVLAPEEIRLKRLLGRESVSMEMAQQILHAQVSDEERKKLANYLIENKADLKALEKKVDQLLDKWKTDGLL